VAEFCKGCQTGEDSGETQTLFHSQVIPCSNYNVEARVGIGHLSPRLQLRYACTICHNPTIPSLTPLVSVLDSPGAHWDWRDYGRLTRSFQVD
jgi:hypothetical protein